MLFMDPMIALKAANDNVRLGEGYDRLIRSLDGLLVALERQSVAVADFRGNCASLEASVEECSKGLKRYKNTIDAIDTQGLRRASKALSRTVDGWCEKGDGSEE